MNSVPIEIVENILSMIPNHLYLSRVNRQFYTAILSSKKLTLGASPSLQRVNIQTIIKRFKSLQEITLEQSSCCNPDMIHKVALQFQGSPTITHIDCVSDYIIYGAIQCPRLISLHIPIQQTATRDVAIEESIDYPDFDILKNRDLGFIFSQIPNLKMLHLDSPSLMFGLPSYHKLQELQLTSIDGPTMRAIGDRFDHGFRLLKLKHLSLDLDHRLLPAKFLKSISIGCPKLESIRFKYASFSTGFMESFCDYFQHLKSIRFTRCEIPTPQKNWAAIVFHFTSRMPELCALSFKYSAIIQSHEQPLSQQMNSPSKLQHLKLFDINDFRITKTEFKSILSNHSEIKVLRIDVDSDCFVVATDEEEIVLNQQLKNLTHLELRLGKDIGIPRNPNARYAQMRLENLKYLAVWGFSVFPDHLVLPNAEFIEQLDLKYALNSPDKSKEYRLVRLRSLSIRALTHFAQQICHDILSSLTRFSSNLVKLSVDAINHKNPEPFDGNLFEKLTQTCPRIRDLRLLNFIIDRSSLQTMTKSWPNLRSLSIKGNGCIETITEEFEDNVLFPFVKKHSSLSAVSLGVGGIQIPDIGVPEFEGAEFMHNFPHLAGASHYGLFRIYEARLSLMFPRCRFTIRAPAQGTIHIAHEP